MSICSARGRSRNCCQLLREAAAHVAHPAIRNRGTIGGNLAHADPASELPACMLVLDATLVIRGLAQERRVAARDFFQGIYATALAADELLTAIEIPLPAPGTKHFFHEYARRSGDYALVGLAATAQTEGGRLSDLRLGYFAVGDRPLLARAAARLVGTDVTPELVAEATAELAAELDPASDQQASAPMRRHLAGLLLGELRRKRARSARTRAGARIMTQAIAIALTVNGESVAAEVKPRLNLADFLRDDLGLTGTHVGCEHGVCGACTVRLDGEIVRACLTLAVQADGCAVDTIEGLSDSGEIADLQNAFRDRNALQCGYCTPGMLITAQDLLLQKPRPDRAEIREHLSGNYCRCTGYHAIIDAVESTARARAERKS